VVCRHPSAHDADLGRKLPKCRHEVVTVYRFWPRRRDVWMRYRPYTAIEMIRRARTAIPGRRRRNHGQAMVEIAMVLPVFMAVMTSCVDSGRYVYIRATLTHNARTAARLAALTDNRATDCPSLAAAGSSGGGFTISQDPNSKVGDTGIDYTSPPTGPPAGSGYAYIYPAIATNNTGTCTGGNRTGAGTPPSVTVRITYLFAPVTPISFVGTFTIITSSTQPTAY
jgi:Flp pilus assembly protein TadG